MASKSRHHPEIPGPNRTRHLLRHSRAGGVAAAAAGCPAVAADVRAPLDQDVAAIADADGVVEAVTG